MKSFNTLIYLTAILLISSSTLFAQCPSGSAFETLSTGDVTTSLSNSGNIWAGPNYNAGYQTEDANPDGDVAMIFTGSVWMGGVDPGGNLKTSAATYGVFNGQTDYSTGPLTEDGQVFNCDDFDRFWKVTKTEINAFLTDFADGTINDPIPPSIASWPAKGNPVFENLLGFALPNTPQGLAPFIDRNSNGNYDLVDGDVPYIKDADQGIWWVINDGGQIHTESNGDLLNMETQILAYSYTTADEPLQSTTFYDFKFINRSIEQVDSLYAGIWIDPDFGCYTDDYIGCDTSRNLAYVYNADEHDGDVDCGDCQGANDFCGDLPIMGIKILNGTDRIENGQVIDNKMSSFSYYYGNNFPITAMQAPQEAVEFYHYLSGSWRDGSQMIYGGTGYSPLSGQTNYVFPDSPDDINGWSMCSEGIEPEDFKIILSSGSSNLPPGGTTTMSIAIFKAYGNNYPCPSLENLFEVDDIITHHIGGITSTKEIEKLSNNQVSFSPNPLTNFGTLRLENTSDLLAQVNLFSLDGKKLRTYREINSKMLTIEKRELVAGVYFYRLLTKEGKWSTGKVVVQ